MRYKPITRQFWQIGYRLFHGKFLNFMRGLGNQGNVKNEIYNSGYCSPEESKINFCVPKKSHLTSSCSLMPNEMKPGILLSMLEFISKSIDTSKKSWKVCVDLKKINSSKTGDMSTVDLWGNEEHPNKAERENKLREDDEIVGQLSKKIEELSKAHFEESIDLISKHRAQVVDKLQRVIHVLSNNVKDLRLYLVGKNSKLDNLMKQAEKEETQDWRNSKYSYAISAIKTNIFQTKECIDSLLEIIDRLCHFCAFLNGKVNDFVSNKTVLFKRQNNLACLTGDSDDNEGGDNSRHIMQRSNQWMKLMKEAKVTASTLHAALGLGTLKKQQEHYDTAYLKKENHITVNEAMLHGTKNEKHGVATIVGKILPVFFPTVRFHEVGCYVMRENNKPFLVASPDGEGWEGQIRRMLFEIKCPFKNTDWKTPVLYTIPDYYIPQVICQMGAAKASLGYFIYECLFVSWSEESATAFRVKFDEALWRLLIKETEELYGGDKRGRPAKKRNQSKELQAAISLFRDNNVRFLGEFKSLQGIECSHLETRHETGPYHYHRSDLEIDLGYNHSMSDISKQLEDARKLLHRKFTLSNPRPSDIMVFMLSDLDRTFDGETPYVFPIAYGLSPKVLKAETVRQMLDDVRKTAKMFDINIEVEAFDGQFNRLAVVSKTGKGLTLLEEQKQHWKRICSESCTDLQRKLNGLGIVDGKIVCFQDVVEKMDLEICRPLNQNMNVDCHGALHVQRKEKIELNVKCSKVMEKALLRVEKTATTDSNATVSSSDLDIERNRNSENLDIEKPVKKIKGADYEIMLKFLKLNSKPKRKKKWQVMNIEEFKTYFSTGKEINQRFTRDELKELWGVCLNKVEAPPHEKKISLSSNKLDLVNFFASYCRCSDKVERKKEKMYNPKTLKGILKDKIKSMRKSDLNSIFALHTWNQDLSDWHNSNYYDYDWFSVPEINNEKPLLRFLDHHHLLTNCRIHCCKSGFPKMNIAKTAWLKIAKDCKNNKTGLNISFVEDLVDSQSNAIAQLTFSKPVEEEMRKNGDVQEANFCALMREWYEAVDEKGITAMERVSRLMKLREYLLGKAKLELKTFPPPGKHVSDMPVILFSGLVLSCERLIQLYRLCDFKGYNARAVSSLDNETFFSSFRDLDPRGAGVLRPSEIPKAMSISCEILATRLNPNRGFYFKTTSKIPVYQESVYENATPMSEEDMASSSSEILFNNHITFDSTVSTSRKRKNAAISSFEECAHGSQGIRQYHRKDDDKILPHKRACIDL